MNCFQLIKTVLDEAYKAVPGTIAAKEAAVGTELTQLSKEYKNLTNSGCLDYSDPARRFAYIFRYTTSHANLVYECIRGSKELRGVFDGSRVLISCVGGGPGSDFLGVLKYCEAFNKAPEVKCLLLDRDPAWGESWLDVDEKVGTTQRMTTVFNSLDVTDPAKWKAFTKHHQADLFTLIYFMSEVYAKKATAEPYFDALFAGMKPGALLLFVDNNDSRFTDWFDGLAKKHGLAVLSQGSGNHTMPTDEDKKSLEPYFTKFGCPKLTANIAWRVVRK